MISLVIGNHDFLKCVINGTQNHSIGFIYVIFYTVMPLMMILIPLRWIYPKNILSLFLIILNKYKTNVKRHTQTYIYLYNSTLPRIYNM